MSRRLLTATVLPVLAALAITGPAAAQPRNQFQQIRPPLPPVAIPHQPTNAELLAQITQLNDRVAQLSERLSALNQHVASLSGQLGTLVAREQDHFRRLYATLYETCRLLYQHHWAASGANPTPGNPYDPITYCRAQAAQGSVGD